MTTIKGTRLHPEDQRYVLSAYVHRFTGEHKPAWAMNERKDGQAYPVQHVNDNDWLEHTIFWARTDGRLDQRVHRCESTPTWPMNPELRK